MKRHPALTASLIVLLALTIMPSGLASAQFLTPGKGQGVDLGALLDKAEKLAREGHSKAQEDEAISMFEEALEIAQARGRPAAALRACNLLFLIYAWRGDYDKASEYAERGARLIAEKDDNCRLLAIAMRNRGIVHMAQGRYEAAAASCAEALRTAERCGEKMPQAWTYSTFGRVRRYQDRFSEALTLLKKGLVLSEELGILDAEGNIRVDMGAVYAAMGRYSEAADELETALSIGEQISRPRVQMEALAGLGLLYLEWGMYQEATEYLKKNLDQARRYGDKRLEAEALLSQGNVYAEWGRYADALACFQKSLSLAKATGVVRHEARILGGMGRVFSSRGQYGKAIEAFEKALAQSRRIGSAQGQARVLTNLGLVYAVWGDHDKALEYIKQGLALSKKIGVPTASSAASIGHLYLDMGDVGRAEPFIRDAGEDGSLGRLCLVKADYDAARRHYESLLESAQESRRINDLFTAYTGLGMAYEGMDALPEAEQNYRKAVELTEDLRSSLSYADRETFFEVRIEGFYRTAPYEGLARALTKMKRPSEAFKESEYARARIFAEAISKRSEYSGLDVPKEVRETDAALADQVAALTKNLQLAYERHSQAKISALEPQVKEAREKLGAHVNMLREHYPLFAATRYPRPMDLSQTALRENEWVLAFHVTDPGLMVYLSRGKEIEKAAFKPIERQALDALVRAFREPLDMNPGDDILKKLRAFDFSTGKKLADLLLGDVLTVLPKDALLIIVPDDCLGVLPFEMLPLNDSGKIVDDTKIPQVSGAEFFGDRNLISYCQSITALTLSRTYGAKEKPKGKVLVFADPVFQTQDARCGKPEKAVVLAGAESDLYVQLMSGKNEGTLLGASLSRLSLTSTLAEHLGVLYPDSAECFTGLQASKERFMKQVAPSLSTYDKIVFATHGYFGKDLPGIREPVLILTLVPPGTDGFLRMSEVTGLKMNADLVALTACQSGLGKKISGEGTMGMGRAFQYAGAKSVLMSLWSVEQTAAVNIVESLFKYMKDGKSKVESLRSARKEVRDQGYDHPFFWAPFILVGEGD